MPDDLVITALARARLKIEWAKNHIHAVEALVTQVAADNASVVSIQNNFRPGEAVVTVGPKNHVDAGLPLHAGDAVHALNSCWDYLWSGLARSTDPSLATKVTAPRHKTRESLETGIDGAKGRDASIYRAFPQARDFVLDGVRPYDPAGGGSLIWQIGRLDNINKHRLLVMTPYLIAFDGDLILEGSDGGKFVHSASATIRTQGHPLIIALTPPVKLHREPTATVTVVFAESDLPSAQPVHETLVKFTDATTALCDLFEATFI